jgi:hypothetical protein
MGSTTSACLDQFREIVAREGEAAWLVAGPGDDSALLNLPADFLSELPAEARPQAQIGVVSAACPGALTLDADALQVPFRCTDAGGRELSLDDYVVGVKRVNVRQSDRNQNPAIVRVEFDGTDWPEDEVKEVSACSTSDYDYEGCPEGARTQIAAIVDPASFETGSDEYQRDFSEQLVIQHYATEGIFESEIRVASDPRNGWVARRSASGTEVQMWFVVRDDRGGVSWTERRVRVR